MNAAALPAFEASSMAELVQIDSIDTETQIRTRNGFDEKSIAELSASIATFGLLQPIVVRQIDPPCDMAVIEAAGGEFKSRYVVIAGHRRLAACKLAGMKSIPAVTVSNVPAPRVHEMQLVENIQREQLSLADTADAVRQLLTLHKTPATVAAIVSKSQSWVSKHLTLTAPSFSDDVRQLLESGATEDLELLVTLNQIAKQPDSDDVLRRLVGDVVTNEAGRKEARATLARLKARDEATDAEPDDEEPEDDEAPAGQTFTLTFDAERYEAIDALGGAKWIRRIIARELKKSEAA